MATGNLVTGIHHVTALARDPARNARFYTEALGLRLVKRTVNFDDPSTYHLYFGDRAGRPGSLITFFPHPQAARGGPGSREVSLTIFAAPPGSLSFWNDRLRGLGAEPRPDAASAVPRILFEDADGTRLAIEERADARGLIPPTVSGIPAEHAITGIGSVRLAVGELAPTAAFLTNVLGYRQTADDGRLARFELPGGGPGDLLEVEANPSLPPARLGAGSVHHVAFRVANDEAQLNARSAVAAAGPGVTEVKDRNYFRSIYFREPGSVIFEIATDAPGFLIDEPDETLGTALKLPSQYERARPMIEAALPPLDLREGVGSP